MTEEISSLAKEVQRKARGVFWLLGIGCFGALVYGAIMGDGLKNWRADQVAQEQSRQAAFESQRTKIKTKDVVKLKQAPQPEPVPSPKRKDADPLGQQSLVIPPTTLENGQADTMVLFSQKIQNSLAEYLETFKTYQGFTLVAEDESFRCLSAIPYVTIEGNAVSVVLVRDCHQGQARSYGCLDSTYPYLIALSEEQYLSAAAHPGYCLEEDSVRHIPSGTSGQMTPQRQPVVSGGAPSELW